MLNILTIIGARPQIIKAAALSRAISQGFADKVFEKILHTGQHYDENMSGGFFGELGIPAPDYNLHVGSGSHGEQTAKMLQGIEQVLRDEHFDGVVLYGDTNSTLAGAVAAGKMHVPVFHVEAGLRSFNMAMPEEANRIVCDHLASILFAPTQTAVRNLEREGFASSAARFKNGKGRKVVLSGDVMFDNSMHYATIAEQRSTVLERVGVERNNFILCTIHRDNNTDSPERLSAIVSALLRIAEERKQTIVLPLHPRTKKLLPQNLPTALHERFTSSQYIKIVEPVPFFDIIMLERHASMVLTDSGGVQKEAFFFETPCVILRPETEWVEIVEAGAGIIADADEARIVAAYEQLAGHPVHFPPLFGNAHAAEAIVEAIVAYLHDN